MNLQKSGDRNHRNLETELGIIKLNTMARLCLWTFEVSC